MGCPRMDFTLRPLYEWNTHYLSFYFYLANAADTPEM